MVIVRDRINVISVKKLGWMEEELYHFNKEIPEVAPTMERSFASSEWTTIFDSPWHCFLKWIESPWRHTQ